MVAATARNWISKVWYLGLSVLVALGYLVLAARPAAAADEPGLEFRSETSYELQPDAQLIHVNQVITVTNTKPEERDGNVVRRIFYNGVKLPVPVGAKNVAAVSGGTVVQVDILDAGGKSVAPAEIKFPSLFYGQSRTIYFAYDLPGDPPRSKGLLRVNPAYASFVAFGVGDQRKVDVSVSIPAGFETETFGADVPAAANAGTTVYAANGIVAPDDWYLQVSARADAALAKTDVDVGGHPLSVRSWPGDDEWSSWVNGELRKGVPELEQLVGQPWPIKDRLEIIEAVTPYLRGYAGWYQPQQNRIEVGEKLDERTLLHELSHVWFNRSFFTSRWINEGMAEEYSAQATTKLGGTVDEPKPVNRSDPNAVTLEDWSAPKRRDSASDVEEYGYNTSWSVIHQLTAEIGVEGMAKVVDGALAHRSAYPGADANEATAGDADWKRFLDLLEERGGSTKATELFAADVVGPADTELLTKRTAARAAYHELAAAGNGWAAPQGVRTLMSEWSFEPAMSFIDKANAVIVLRDELQAVAAKAELTLPTGAQDDYQAARSTDDLDKIVEQMNRQMEAAHMLASAKAAVASPRDRFARFGLYNRHPETDLAKADSAFAGNDTAGAVAAASRVMATVEQARTVGQHRAAMVGGAFGGLALLGIGGMAVGTRRRRHRRADATTFGGTAVAMAMATAGGERPIGHVAIGHVAVGHVGSGNAARTRAGRDLDEINSRHAAERNVRLLAPIDPIIAASWSVTPSDGAVEANASTPRPPAAVDAAAAPPAPPPRSITPPPPPPPRPSITPPPPPAPASMALARLNGGSATSAVAAPSPVDVDVDVDVDERSPIGLEESDADGLRWMHQPREGEPYASRITRARRWRVRADDDDT